MNDLTRIAELKKNYRLQQHPEGGWFSEVYTAPFERDGRAMMGSIYFLLEGGDISHFHQIDCDELWYHHEGCPLRVTVLHDGACKELLLGGDVKAGQQAMAMIPAGAIFAAENLEPDGYSFLSCATTPAFRYEGFRLVSQAEITAIPCARPELLRLAYEMVPDGSPVKKAESTEIDRLKEIVKTLRGEHGCAWDRAQTHGSLKPPCIEEAAEVICGINILEQTGDPANLREELGDLLLQVVFHAVIAEEEGLFTFEDVAKTVADKMVRRHPHVFAGAKFDSEEALHEAWAEIKKQEKAGREWESAYLEPAMQEASALIEQAKQRKGFA